MTIAKRLAILAAISIISLIVVSLGGYIGMHKMNGEIREINNDYMPSIQVLDELKDNFLRRRLRILQHVLTNDESSMDAIEKDMAGISERIEGDLKQYDKYVSDEKDKAMYEADKKAYADYIAIITKVQQLSRSGRKQEAADLLKNDQKALADITATVIAHAKYNVDLATKSGINTEAMYNRLVIILLIVALLAIIITAGLSIATYSTVTGSLENLRNTITDIEKNLDFTKRATAQNNDEIGLTINAVNRLIQRLQDNLRTLVNHTGAVSAAAEKLSNAANEVSSSSAQQSSAAADMAATVEQLTVSINHVADQASEANSLSAESGALAQSGEQIIAKTVDDINGIATTVRSASEFVDNLDRDSQRINTVIAVIKEVADQTNLLALNAAIEAARAGEQGRGFAVVADEVRKLAERTAKSTQEITETIDSMQINARSTVDGIEAVQTSVARGVERAGEANSAIAQIGESSRHAVERVAEITNAIREQGHASTNIAQQLERIAQMSEENNAAAGNTSSTAVELDKLAQEMKHIIDQYRI